jgi:hypothetical protein
VRRDESQVRPPAAYAPTTTDLLENS